MRAIAPVGMPYRYYSLGMVREQGFSSTEIHDSSRVHWLVQGNREDRAEVVALLRAIEGAGGAAHLVDLRKDHEMALPDLPPAALAVCHGAGFVTRAWNHPVLGSGLFFDPATFRWSACRAAWGTAMLSPDGMVMPLSQARQTLSDQGPAFVRPDEDSKAFDGGVHSAISLPSSPPDIEVVVAKPVPIEAEWRFFVVNREVVDCSSYRIAGMPSIAASVPRAAIELAMAAAAEWGPADVYCLDLASSLGRIGIVEANCFNAARFYGAKIDRVLRAVNEYMLARP